MNNGPSTSVVTPAMSSWFKPVAQMVRQVGRGRVAVAILGLAIAVFIGRWSWHIPLTIDAEHALFDARMTLSAPVVKQDNRVVIVPYTDETLINTGKRSPLDRATLARALAQLDKMGAKAIGIDILIDQPQAEDAQLIATFRNMHTPTFVAYASTRTASDKILYRQQQFLEDFQHKIATRFVHPASIVVQTDSDNVMRRWADVIKGAPPRMPNALMPEARDFAKYTGTLVYYRSAYKDQPVFPTIPIDTFANDTLFATPEATALFRQQIAGRYVLLGGNIEDIDIFQTPLSRAAAEGESGSTWGMDLFAFMLAQMMDHRLINPIPNSLLWIAAIVIVAAGGLTATRNRRPIVSATLLLLQLGILFLLPFWLMSKDYETYDLPAFGWLVSWFFGFVVVSSLARALGSEQRRFAQSALGKYLPRDIAAEILKDPDSLQLRGEKREIFVLFSDLEGFTKLSHAIAPEMVAFLLNRYLEMLSNIVLEHGGTIDKFVGDAVVAFWGAPISRPDDGARAVKAAIAMNRAGEAFRKNVPDGVPPIGMTRVGLHHGEAIVGNFGGEGRIQYTALGDSMNTAARLESANKQTKSGVLVSETAVAKSGLDIFRPLGDVVLRGRGSKIGIYEPVPDMEPDARHAFTQQALKAIGGDAAALAMLQQTSKEAPKDLALANFVYRLTHAHEGGYYVLD